MFIVVIFLIIGMVTGYDESKCDPADLPKAMKCLKNHQEVRQKAVTLDLDNDKNMLILNNTCIDFLKCSTPMKCGADETDSVNIDKAISYCHAVAFHVSDEYLKCANIVDTKNSTCVQGWNPFPEFDEKAEGLEELKREACRSFFGKNGCLEGEISENCGVEMWKDFQKHYLALNDIIEACEFE
ncbi:hypothetical protein CAEBREN_08439 [Caenorhabditis brenneri]|uniref:T20D4.11-like domain-containing protein n=1 Tax=Caenorhabditis brenneri TaxID=135651 RepID=G0MA14_CAEBE|nr:hypothetical protein CAEBREN_08439 [Caenorhabditis brenneri]